MARAFGGPGLYVQKQGEILQLAGHLARLGQRPFILIDRALHDRLKPPIAASLPEGLGAAFGRFGGECTWDEIRRIATLARDHRADIILGLGGGKTLDTAKVAAIETGARLLIAPSIASTDAPCSAVAVVYDAHSIFVESLRLPRNPDIVVVDPTLIVGAPLRFFVAGIGDALSTWYEARSNLESRTDNYVAGGYPPTEAGIAIARRCHEVLMREALKARQAVEAGLCTASVEAIIEANILLSGLGFENCGCSAAHGIHDALTQIEETHGLLHGEKVAFGTLCLLMLENRPGAEIEEAIRFCRALGLPTRLADLGIREDVTAKIARVAEAALCNPQNIIYATPMRLSPQLLRDAILALDAFSAALA